MIRLPYMVYSGTSVKKYNVSFGGLNLTESAEEWELKHSRNVDSSRFPYLASRKPKFRSERLYDIETRSGVCSIWGDGETLALFRGEKGSVGSSAVFRTYGKDVSDVWDLNALWTLGEEKHDAMVRCGSYLLAFTDTETANENGNVAPLYFNLNEDPKDQLGWRSVGCYVNGMAVFEGDKLSLSNSITVGGSLGLCDFEAGDTLTITDCAAAPENCLTLKLTSVEYVEGGMELTFDGASFTTCAEDGVSVSRRVPERLSFPVVVNNRVWGVTSSEICACALGDPTNWEQFEGIASDSYKVAVDSGLDFTGSGVYSSNPVFFKENAIYRLYGSLPSNFTLQRLDVCGVMEGCHKSVCKINEALYYKGRRGVYRYTGGVPVCISECLGDLSQYGEAVAGEDGRKLYISMRKDDEGYLFVYDTETGIWLCEDKVNVLGFARFGSVLYYLDDSFRLNSYTADPDADLTVEDKDLVGWEMEFAPVNEVVKEQKVYSKITLRIELEGCSAAIVCVSRDGGAWEEVSSVNSRTYSGMMNIPIPPKKCDSFALKIKGFGPMCLRGIVREYRTAGDR